MDSPVELFEEVLVIYPRLQTSALVGLACATWQFHDWVITFEQERRLIWTKKPSGGSALYIILRFYSFIFTLSDFIIEITRWTSMAFCKSYYYQVAVSTCFLIGIVQALLQGRVYALYRCDKKLLWGNLAAFTLVLLGNALILWHYLPQSEVVIVPEPLVPRNTILSYIPSIAFETWLCFLVVRKGFKDEQVRGAWPPSGTTILSIMIRDYTAWVICAIVCALGNILTFLYAPLGYQYSGIGILHSFMSIGGCRIILNIRGAYYNVNGSNDTEFRQAAYSAGPMKFEAGKATTVTGTTATRMNFASIDTTITGSGDLEAFREGPPGLELDEAELNVHDGLNYETEKVDDA